MLKNIKKRSQGFTIIEVLIVLAIAGLIMLIVFLAVPALQRNSRNTQRKNDAASLLGAVTEWANNNNGKMPTTTAEQTEALANANLGIYSGAVSWTATPTDTNGVRIVINAKCQGESHTTTTQNRSVVTLYRVESGSGGTAGVTQCDES